MDEIMTDSKFEELLDQSADANRPVICIFQDADGNWRGAYAKNGKDTVTNPDTKNPSVFSRAIGPETVLQELLTNDGKM